MIASSRRPMSLKPSLLFLHCTHIRENTINYDRTTTYRILYTALSTLIIFKALFNIRKNNAKNTIARSCDPFDPHLVI